jgi:hypothetical protein
MSKNTEVAKCPKDSWPAAAPRFTAMRQLLVHTTFQAQDGGAPLSQLHPSTLLPGRCSKVFCVNMCHLQGQYRQPNAARDGSPRQHNHHITTAVPGVSDHTLTSLNNPPAGTAGSSIRELSPALSTVHASARDVSPTQHTNHTTTTVQLSLV